MRRSCFSYLEKARVLAALDEAAWQHDACCVTAFVCPPTHAFAHEELAFHLGPRWKSFKGGIMEIRFRLRASGRVSVLWISARRSHLGLCPNARTQGVAHLSLTKIVFNERTYHVSEINEGQLCR